MPYKKSVRLLVFLTLLIAGKSTASAASPPFLTNPTTGLGIVVTACGSAQGILAGTLGPFTVDVNGNLCMSGSTAVTLGAGTAAIGKVGPGYTSAQTPLTTSATGTTAATTATLAGTAGKTTYVCGWSVDADATAATAGDMTVTGVVTGTLTRRQGVAAVAAGTASTWQVYSPCLPASAANTGIAVVSIAAGSGGHTDVNAWGYQE